MKHTLDELLDIVYLHYPRGVGMVDGDIDIQLIYDSEEHARLVAAQQKAVTDERWHAMQRRIDEHFPDATLVSYSRHLPGGQDACYSFLILSPEITGKEQLWVHVSFLAPYYIIFSSRPTDIVKEPRKDLFRVIFGGLRFHVARSPLDPELIADVGNERQKLVANDNERQKLVTIERWYVTFELLPDERPYAEWIAREIEATFGCEPLPPEVGTVLVPDLAAPKLPGEVRLYDCLFEVNEWVNPSSADVPAATACVDASNLTEPFLAVLTVLAALYHTLLFLRHSKGYCVVSTDGILRKEHGLQALAEIRRLIESPVAPCGIATKGKLEGAMRELEELLAAWDGNGALLDAMVAWASSFLASWDAGEEG